MSNESEPYRATLASEAKEAVEFLTLASRACEQALKNVKSGGYIDSHPVMEPAMIAAKAIEEFLAMEGPQVALKYMDRVVLRRPKGR